MPPPEDAVLSDDGLYWWDGNDWQPVDDESDSGTSGGGGDGGQTAGAPSAVEQSEDPESSTGTADQEYGEEYGEEDGESSGDGQGSGEGDGYADGQGGGYEESYGDGQGSEEDTSGDDGTGGTGGTQDNSNPNGLPTVRVDFIGQPTVTGTVVSWAAVNKSDAIITRQRAADSIKLLDDSSAVLFQLDFPAGDLVPDKEYENTFDVGSHVGQDGNYTLHIELASYYGPLTRLDRNDVSYKGWSQLGDLSLRLEDGKLAVTNWLLYLTYQD